MFSKRHSGSCVLALAHVLPATSAWLLRQLPNRTGSQDNPMYFEAESARMVGTVNNICLFDRLVPQFFMLGVPKGGTTFVFEQLATSEGMRHYIPGPDEEEYKAKEPWTFNGGFDGGKEWLEHWPACDTDQRLVAVDATPGYFSDPKAVHAINKAYAAFNVHKALVFMVILREPMSRSQSHFYYMIQQGVLDGTYATCLPEQFPATFQQGVRAYLDAGAVEICQCSCDNLWRFSKYVSSFEKYFDAFPGEQLHVTTMKYVPSHDLVQYLWRILRVPEGHGKPIQVQGNDEQNSVQHPKLEEDLDGATLEEYQARVDLVASPQNIAKMLVNQGANLFGYDGEAGSVDGVKDWLRATW